LVYHLGLNLLLPIQAWAAPDIVLNMHDEHPRMLIRAADIETLKTNVTKEPVLGLWNFIKNSISSSSVYDDPSWIEEEVTSNSDRYQNLAMSFALAYLIEGDARYRDTAIIYAREINEQVNAVSASSARDHLLTMAFLYDWLYNSIDSNTRSSWRNTILAVYARTNSEVKNNGNWKYEEQIVGHAHFGVVSRIIGMLAIYGDSSSLDSQVRSNLDEDIAFYSPFIDAYGWIVSKGDSWDNGGGFFLGWGYARQFQVKYMLNLFKIFQTAANVDLLSSQASWLKEVGYHFVYGIRPDKVHPMVGDAFNRQHFTPDDLAVMPLLARTYINGYFQDYSKRALDWLTSPMISTTRGNLIWGILHFDPNLSPTSITSLPLTRTFQRAGNYIMRSGWNMRGDTAADESIPGDTHVVFRARPWYLYTHEHKDFNHFLIFHKGPLAIDAGRYGSGITGFSDHHWSDYHSRTIAHNSIVVYKPGEDYGTWTDDNNVRHDRANDGGQEFKDQTINGRTHRQPWNYDEMLLDSFQVGRVPVYEDTADYTYLVGQTGEEIPGGYHAYQSNKVRDFTRNFLFLKKGDSNWPYPQIIIFDRVKSQPYKKTWLLHTMGQPTINGSVVTVKNEMRIPAGDSEQWNRYDGRLYSETLLPVNALIEKIGGPGKEYWVDGGNTPIPEDIKYEIQEPGDWRIEVSPASIPSGTTYVTDFFLHVLSPCDDADTRSMPVSNNITVTQGNMAGLITRNQVVLFNKEAQSPTAVNYTLAYSGTLNHLITGLEKGVIYNVYFGGTPFPQEVSTVQGNISFTSPGGGTFRIEKAGVVPPNPSPAAPRRFRLK